MAHVKQRKIATTVESMKFYGNALHSNYFRISIIVEKFMKKRHLILLMSFIINISSVQAEALITGQAPAGQDIKEIVNIVQQFMLASMASDKETTDRYLATDAKITFTGGIKFAKPEEIGVFNSKRYKQVKKSIERWDVTYDSDELIVYSMGTLYGEWLDGTPFEGNRYIDRFVIVNGKITKMDVWNDSAELMLQQK